MNEIDGLDHLDRRIIAALQVDGRKTFSTLAEELEVPASSIRYRLKRLEDDGVLQVVGIANPLAIGFDRLAMIGVSVRPGTARAVCTALAALPETSYVVLTSGRFDVLVEVICRDVAHIVDVLENKIGALDEVVATESFFVLEVHKLAYGWGVPEVSSAD
ncbi:MULTISPECIES: Lrp/AsnC family transcriptional regulator [Microbacterium]|uniref:Lrp/AsnC family transcriptional regulator n=1 Tax=Microbacterium resistens TaxID=156977 RepID=A0ABY3RVM5_9MICO|nr:Lrp/AsnC family transcriptional regulator [Microbacterium resistens]MBW1638429.1 Lrp/AsnC family transcriptional regulator [Microbacterium resistens]MDA4891705.1 Lrp/AsnC family transcriptional regulator [Streptomyces sp. MS2A]UGS28123.1 Lrp/AsnC family transcriptional regulator [Microbacterium resistens]